MIPPFEMTTVKETVEPAEKSEPVANLGTTAKKAGK